MAGPIKGTAFYQAGFGVPRTVGWSESIYFPGITTPAGGLPRLQTLNTLRCQMFGQGVLNTFLRTSDDEVFRDSAPANGLTPSSPAGVSPFYNPRLEGAPADFAGTAWYLLCAGGDPTYRRILWLSANPDVSQETDFTSPQGAAWHNAEAAFEAALINGNYGFKVNDVANVRSEIINVVGGTFTTLAAHGLVPGSVVKITQVKGRDGEPPNGKWTVFTSTLTTFTLVGYTQVAFVYKEGGFVREQSFIVTPITRVIDRQWGTKKRGRPFDLPRGRRPKRAQQVLKY